MPRIPRYVQNSLALGVPSSQFQDAQDRQRSNEIRQTFNTLGRINATVAQFQERQFMNTNAVKLDSTIRDMTATWQQQNLNSPDGPKDSFRDSVNKQVEAMIEAAPNGLARSSFRTRANQQIERAVSNLDSWGRRQKITNLVDDTNFEAEKLSKQARLGGNVDELNANLGELTEGLRSAISDEKLQQFETEHRSEIFYRHGLARIEDNPKAGEALLKNKKFTDALKVEHIEALKRATNRGRQINQETALRRQIEFRDKPADFLVGQGKIPIFDFSKDPDQLEIDIKRRNEEMDLIDPGRTKFRLATSEVSDLVSRYNAFGDDGKVQMMRIARSIGGEDLKLQKLAGRQIFKKDPIMGAVLSYSAENPELAKSIIIGDRHLRTGNVDKDEMKKFRDLYQDFMSDVDMPQLNKDQLESGIKSMYAFNIQERGLKNKDSIQAAFKEMLGEKVRVGSTSVFPFRLKTGEFATEFEMDFVMDNLDQEILDRHNVAPTRKGQQKIVISDFKKADITLQPHEQDTYKILLNGGALFDKTTGKHAIFNFSDLFHEMLQKRNVEPGDVKNPIGPLSPSNRFLGGS